MRCRIDRVDHAFLLLLAQIIWKMVSHLLQFSAILMVVMIGFATSFYSLFSECESDDMDGHDMPSFRSFQGSVIILFDALLGNVDFVAFDSRNIHCPGPAWIPDLGVLLLSLYMIVMAIMLLNLLIAVLSTVHADVYKNVEKEFNLARTKIIYKTAAGVSQVTDPPHLWQTPNANRGTVCCMHRDH